MIHKIHFSSNLLFRLPSPRAKLALLLDKLETKDPTKKKRKKTKKEKEKEKERSAEGKRMVWGRTSGSPYKCFTVIITNSVTDMMLPCFTSLMTWHILRYQKFSLICDSTDCFISDIFIFGGFFGRIIHTKQSTTTL